MIARFRSISLLVQWKDCALSLLREKNAVRPTARHKFPRNSAWCLGAFFIASAVTRSLPAILLFGIYINFFSIRPCKRVAGTNNPSDQGIGVGALLSSFSESLYSRKFGVLPCGCGVQRISVSP